MAPSETKPAVRRALSLASIVVFTFFPKNNRRRKAAGCQNQNQGRARRPSVRLLASIYLASTVGLPGCQPWFRLSCRLPSPPRCHPVRRLIGNARVGGRLFIGARSSRPRCHPQSRSSSGLVKTFRLGSLFIRGRPLNRMLRIIISGLLRHCCRPDRHRKQLSHSPWFPE